MAAIDPTRLLGGSEPAAQRQGHHLEVFTAWHEALLTHGLTGYEFDEVLVDFRLGSLYNLMVPVSDGLMVGNTGLRGLRLLDAIVERVYVSALELDAGSLLPGTSGSLGKPISPQHATLTPPLQPTGSVEYCADLQFDVVIPYIGDTYFVRFPLGRPNSKTKTPVEKSNGVFEINLAIPTFALVGTIIGPESLTAVFGMGTGVSFPVWSPEEGAQRGQTLRT